MRLEGKIAVVTGAGQGMGRTHALTLAREGADVVVNDIDLEAAQKVADEIKKATRCRVLAIQADVSQKKEVDGMVKKTMDVFKRVDILVNNAGIVLTIPTVEMTEEQWDRVMGINIKGQFLCAQAFGREMIKQRQGKIINIASTGGLKGVPKMIAYCVSKGGVLQLTRTLAVEWAEYNINVNTVTPGHVRTAMVEEVKKQFPDFFKERLKTIPMARPAEPQDVANAVLFLASSESDYISGINIIVDGGSYALHPGYHRTEE